MTLQHLANLVLKLYHNGTVKITDVQLTENVMKAHLKNAYVFIIKQNIEAKRKSGIDDDFGYVSGAIGETVFDVKKSGRRSRVDMSKNPMLQLDEGMQIIDFRKPTDDCGCGNESSDLDSISYVTPLEVKFYPSPTYDHLMFYTLTGPQIIDIYNLPECLKKLEIQYVKDSEAIDIPGDVCFQVCKVAMPDIFNAKKVGKGKIDDNSNEMIEQLKLQLLQQ